MIVDSREAGKRSAIVRGNAAQRRTQIVLAMRAQGKTVKQIAVLVKMSPSAVWRGLRKYGYPDACRLIQEELAKTPVTAEDLHISASEMWNADPLDIMVQVDCDCADAEEDAPCTTCYGVGRYTTGAYKPFSAWPRVFRVWGAELRTREIKEQSHDGELPSWDAVATIIMAKWPDRMKLFELLGRHKAVDGFTREKSGDVNIMVVTADQARQVAGARRRLELVSSSVIDAESTT